MSMLKEFEEFAMKDNAVDLASELSLHCKPVSASAAQPQKQEVLLKQHPRPEQPVVRTRTEAKAHYANQR